MTEDLAKLCRVRNTVRIGPPIHRIPKGSLTCPDCGWVDLPEHLLAKLTAKAVENDAAAQRRKQGSPR